MHERMSIACNEENFLKKKRNDKNNKDKGKDTNLQVLHMLYKERKYVGFVVEIIWPMFVHIEIKSPVTNGIRIPWSHIIHSSKVHMYIMSKVIQPLLILWKTTL